MTVETETPIPLIPLANYTAGQPVRQEDWGTFNKATNTLYANSGVVSAGLVFDPVFTTTDTSYTANNGAGGRDLDTFSPVLRQPLRAWSSGAERLFVGFTAFGENIWIQATYIAADTGSTLATLQVDSSAITAAHQPYIYGATTLSWASAFEGSSKANPLRSIGVHFTVKWNSSGGGATLYAICAQYIALDAAQLPTAES